MKFGSGENQKTDVKMSKVIDKTLEMLMSRIEEGDYQYDQKTGRLVKVPLKARDLERISSGLFDKRRSFANNQQTLNNLILTKQIVFLEVSGTVR